MSQTARTKKRKRKRKQLRIKTNSNSAQRCVLPETTDVEELDKQTQRVIFSVGSIMLLSLLGQSTVRKNDIVDQLSVPSLGEFALYMLLSKTDRDYVIGDLAEEFVQVCAKFGRHKAQIWYYKQVLSSVWPLFSKAMRLGFVAWAEEWIRRRI